MSSNGRNRWSVGLETVVSYRFWKRAAHQPRFMPRKQYTMMFFIVIGWWMVAGNEATVLRIAGLQDITFQPFVANALLPFKCLQLLVRIKCATIKMKRKDKCEGQSMRVFCHRVCLHKKEIHRFLSTAGFSVARTQRGRKPVMHGWTGYTDTIRWIYFTLPQGVCNVRIESLKSLKKLFGEKRH